MVLQVRQVVYVPWEGDPGELIAIADAAKLLGVRIVRLSHAIERGVLTEVVDSEAGYHGRRKLLRSEVEQYREKVEK